LTNEQNRRSFLKISALGLSATATANLISTLASPAAALGSKDAGGAPSGEIAVRVTSGKQRYEAVPSAVWRSGAPPKRSVITIDPEKKFQEMLGFGGAMTDATCYTLNRLASSDRDQLLHNLFHPSEMGFSVCRTCIGASDYSTEVFSYDEGDPDPEMRRFSIDHDTPYVLPMLRLARQVNPDLFLFSSPWSPPGWMKAGSSMLGGAIRPHFFGPYAQYFLKFLQGYAAEGVPVQAVTVQNEVDTDQDGRMPACTWAQEYEIQFVKNFLGPVLKQNGIDTRIWILDHNYNLWGRAICELDDPALRQYCNSVAFHGYVGTPEMMTKVHDAHPDAQLYWTEGGPDYTSPDYQTDWTTWGRTFTAAIRNWVRSITAWNIALDEKGKPNVGPFSCGGMVTIHSQTREITRSGQYWTFAHFSRHVRRGARRLESSGAEGIDHVVFENPDGQRVLVVTNAGPARGVSLKQGDRAAEVELAPDSITTLSWR